MSAHPAPSELFDADRFRDVWPMGGKTELIDGHPWFTGSYDQADVEAAERAFPGRRAMIQPWDGRRGNLILHACDCRPETCDLWPAQAQGA